MKLENLKTIFSLDIRALSVFRIALALLIIYDLTTRVSDLTAHYTDSGILPMQVILNDSPLFQYLYIHFFSGSTGFEAFVFVIAYLFGFLLLIGYKTRLATIISWYLLISLQARNNFILYGSDFLLRILLFWSMFLPLGLCYSVDGILNKAKKYKSNLVFSGWTIGYVIQIALVYFFAAMLKSGAEWHEEKSAVYYALNLETYARPLAESLLQLPGEYLKLLTSAVLWFEYIAPFLLFSPIFTSQVRILAILGLITLHIGFNTFLELGHFGICSIIAILPLLPLKNKANNILKEATQHITEKIAVTLLILYIFTLNIATVNPNFKIHKSIFCIAKYLQLDQQWGMFAPHPAKEDLWPVIVGRLKNKEIVNLLTADQKVNFKKPDSLLDLFPNIRWRSFISLITKTKNFEYLGSNCKYYSKYLCEEWNKNHIEDLKLEWIEFYFMQESNIPEKKSIKPTIIPVLDYNCNHSLAIDINYARILISKEIKTEFPKPFGEHLLIWAEGAKKENNQKKYSAIKSLINSISNEGFNHINVSKDLINLANIYKKEKDFKKAELLYKLALLTWIQNTKEGALTHIQALKNLEELYKSQKRKNEIVIIEGWERLLELTIS